MRKHDETLRDDRKQWEHDRFKLEQGARRDAALGMEIAAAQQREAEDRALLKDLRVRRWSTATILQEHPELGYLLERRNVLNGDVLNSEELKQISTPVAHPTASSGVAPDVTRDLHGITREPREDDIYTISHFSIKVSRRKLSEREAELTQSPAQSFAYFVEGVLASGSNEQDLQPQDLIYQIDDKPVPELIDLAPYLDTRQQRGEPVKVTYLRGENLSVTIIDIPSAQ